MIAMEPCNGNSHVHLWAPPRPRHRSTADLQRRKPTHRQFTEIWHHSIVLQVRPIIAVGSRDRTSHYPRLLISSEILVNSPATFANLA